MDLVAFGLKLYNCEFVKNTIFKISFIALAIRELAKKIVSLSLFIFNLGGSK